MTFVPLKLCQKIGLWCDPSLMIMRRAVLCPRIDWYLDGEPSQGLVLGYEGRSKLPHHA
jgi:hypothetical protein